MTAPPLWHKSKPAESNPSIDSAAEKRAWADLHAYNLATAQYLISRIGGDVSEAPFDGRSGSKRSTVKTTKTNIVKIKDMEPGRAVYGALVEKADLVYSRHRGMPSMLGGLALQPDPEQLGGSLTLLRYYDDEHGSLQSSNLASVGPRLLFPLTEPTAELHEEWLEMATDLNNMATTNGIELPTIQPSNGS